MQLISNNVKPKEYQQWKIQTLETLAIQDTAKRQTNKKQQTNKQKETQNKNRKEKKTNATHNAEN